jgi:hypothetical protein
MNSSNVKIAKSPRQDLRRRSFRQFLRGGNPWRAFLARKGPPAFFNAPLVDVAGV